MSHAASIEHKGSSKEIAIQRTLRRERWNSAKRMKLLYLFFLVPFVVFFVFHYMPMYGLLIAFKQYRVIDGIWGSPWNNFRHFEMLFSNIYFGRILRNTIIISVYRVVFGFPAPILLALLINELRNATFKRITQSISYLPHFFSWVVLASIMIEILSPQRGIVGYLYTLFGADPPNMLTSTTYFRPILVISDIFKEVGWGTVVYLAAISTIDPGLYESASIDGASRLKQARYITLPSLLPIISILLLLRVGYIMNAGFDQIFNLYNPIVYEVADIIDTYVYRVGIIERRFDFSTAVGLFKNAIGVVLLIAANVIIKRFGEGEYAVW